MSLYTDAPLQLIFHNVIALFQMNCQDSDAYFTTRQIRVISKDVRFTLKGRGNNNRNYSVSNNHARIAFEIFLTILTAITIH